jgi:hypothetical protein
MATKLAGMLRGSEAAQQACQVAAAGLADPDAYVRKSAVLGAAALVRQQPRAAQQHRLLETLGALLMVRAWRLRRRPPPAAACCRCPSPLSSPRALGTHGASPPAAAGTTSRHRQPAPPACTTS